MAITFHDNCEKQEFFDVVRMDGLLAYNLEQTGGKLTVPNLRFTHVARNEQGKIVGGVSGFTYLSTLEVEFLWVDEAYRGQKIATGLLAEMERRAKEGGCQLAHLTTYSFQAPVFYQKQGYELCGEVSGFPDDIRLYLLKKQL